jgi:hypothetical protein
MKGNFDPEAAQDSNKMEKLFLLSQMIMRIKATEASIASEEIERMAERYQGRNRLALDTEKKGALPLKGLTGRVLARILDLGCVSK